MHHNLKANPESFILLRERLSEVQLRKNDRNYAVGDTCTFYELFNGKFTGHTTVPLKIVIVLKKDEGLTEGWCLIVLAVPRENITKFIAEVAGKESFEEEYTIPNPAAVENENWPNPF